MRRASARGRHLPQASKIHRERAWRERNPRTKASGEETSPDFLQGYERARLQDVCEADPIRPDQLAVWVNRTGVWTQVDVRQLWKRKGEKESLCRSLVTGLLGMSAAQYESMKDAFEAPDSSERIGVCSKINDNQEITYAVVVRMPKDNKMLLGGAAAVFGLGSAAIGYKAHEVQTSKKSDQKTEVQTSKKSDQKTQWLADYDQFLADAHYLYVLFKPTLLRITRESKGTFKTQREELAASERLLTFVHAIETGRLLSSHALYSESASIPNKDRMCTQVDTLKYWAQYIVEESGRVEMDAEILKIARIVLSKATAVCLKQ
jgi:hypothetical protein